jgi:hypothetical protein
MVLKTYSVCFALLKRWLTNGLKCLTDFVFELLTERFLNNE